LRNRADNVLSSLAWQEFPILSESPEAKAARVAGDVEQIYEKTRSDICSYLICLGVPDAQAQEVTQEVYLRLYQAMHKPDEILNTRAWLFRVAHNLGLKVRTREKAFRVVSPDWERFADTATKSPERSVLDREKMQRLQAALQTLSPQQRNCLYLRAEGLRYREIAQVMGISPSTVNEFLRRAISRLAEPENA
jgi:RNA polymerase sigma-70 factor (ECF subfamily)